MKSNTRRHGKTGAIVALSIILALTVIVGILGVSGMSLPPKGLYKLQSWLPTTDTEKWPASLALGLDLRGGMFVEYSAEAEQGAEADFESLLNGTMTIITQRLSDKGYNEATVQKLGTNGIRVEIPDVDDDTVLDLIGAAAVMRFVGADGSEMSGNRIKTANYFYSDGDHQIAFTLTDEGREEFAAMTAANIGKTITIYLDDEVLIAPTVQSAIPDGNGVINGLGSVERASTIAAQIQSGALPLVLTQQKVDKVSATLGQDALGTAVRAAIIGILLVMLFLIIRYRLNGVIASWALVIYVILLFWLIALFRIQLTLPGLAGVVLGIGMAVDANVIIFERFNEELRAGKSLKSAVRAGFKHAMSAILDGNITTLIAAIVLLIFGTGSIQGFARTLLLGVVVSMFTAVIVTRILMNAVVNIGVKKVSLFARVNTVKEAEK